MPATQLRPARHGASRQRAAAAAGDEAYRDLVITAREALHDVIVAREAGSGAIPLHQALGSLTRTLDVIDRVVVAHPRVCSPADEAHDDWQRLGWRERCRALLDALGEGRHTVGELAGLARTTCPCRSAPDLELGYTDVYPLLIRLLDAGAVQRERAEIVKGRPVWRYRRRQTTADPIAELAPGS